MPHAQAAYAPPPVVAAPGFLVACATLVADVGLASCSLPDDEAEATPTATCEAAVTGLRLARPARAPPARTVAAEMVEEVVLRVATVLRTSMLASSVEEGIEDGTRTTTGVAVVVAKAARIPFGCSGLNL